MQKTPVKDLHVKRRGLWPNRPRADVNLNGERAENFARLGELIAAAREKTIELGDIGKKKADEQEVLKKQLAAAFKKTPGLAHQKAVAKIRMDFENHLHHTIRELELKKMELKAIYHELNCVKERLRKD